MKYLLSVRATALEPRHRRIRNDGDAKECQNEQACNRTCRKRIRRVDRITFFRRFRWILTFVCQKSGTRPVHLTCRHAENDAIRMPAHARGQTLSEKHKLPLLR